MPGQLSPRLRLGKPLFRNANTGAGQDFTGLTAAVQLRLRVAVPVDGHLGLQTLTVKSRLLPGENTVRIRGNPPSFACNPGDREGCKRRVSSISIRSISHPW